MNKYFTNDTIHSHRFKTLEATPYTEHSPEMFILGMSEQSAELAAKGLPFVIAHMVNRTQFNMSFNIINRVLQSIMVIRIHPILF